ncbi:MAG: ATP-dependent Clp protease adaptor ClpS [Planctomycetota bacterium]
MASHDHEYEFEIDFGAGFEGGGWDSDDDGPGGFKVRPDHEPATATATATEEASETDKPWLWNVVLLDDDHHTYDYVIRMVMELFAKPLEGAYLAAKTVDADGRVVLLTTHKEHAELKRDQIHAYGKDALIAGCQGSMSAVIEPAYPDDEDEDASGDTSDDTPPADG